MSNRSSATAAARLRAAVRAVQFDATAIAALGLPPPAAARLHQPKPAQTCRNLPEPASPSILQNEANAPAPSSIHHRPSTHQHSLPPSPSVPNFQTNPPRLSHRPAETCQNLPESASTPDLQNKPTAPSSIRHPPFSSPSSLTPRQLHAARLLVDGYTTKAAAARLAVNPHTVSQWKKLPPFQAELTRLLNDLAPPRPARACR
jgi:hypothetical protein